MWLTYYHVVSVDAFVDNTAVTITTAVVIMISTVLVTMTTTAVATVAVIATLAAAEGGFRGRAEAAVGSGCAGH